MVARLEQDYYTTCLNGCQESRRHPCRFVRFAGHPLAIIVIRLYNLLKPTFPSRGRHASKAYLPAKKRSYTK